MRPTAEMRWFYDGAVPDMVTAWLSSLEAEGHQGTARIDYYLRPTDAATNVKQREGRLEVKRLDATGMAVTLAGAQQGLLERWRKWSFASDDLDEPGARATASLFWIPVWKQRIKCFYQLDPEGQVRPRTAGEAVRRGCDLELTRVERDDYQGWSLGFEAFGAETMLQDTLIQVGHHVFTREAAPHLSLDHSLSYAAWLLRS